jgi:prepilin-type processing-associated H-X9-DG protein
MPGGLPQGPTNYHFCTGDGSPGSANPGDAGLSVAANGAFVLGPPQSMASIIDGSSGTAAASEQLLGPAAGGASSLSSPTPRPGEVRRAAAMTTGTLSDSGCVSASSGWRLDKGNAWWDGDYRSTLYNHYLTPNSKVYDCWLNSPPHNPAWKAARSNHPGGVNVVFCDGHVQFVKDSVNLNSWRALSTRKGGEVISADAF